ncbi:sarcosine oxidase subunit delta [Ensifer soli]|uniref:sarcosine oxidase subunit delta n=1 Tax=Ciceribacter sp. sgz301302 TaxID=3342379 RepID=UPI0035B8629B
MASLIHCPHCGLRPTQEFSVRGDASLARPDVAAPDDAWNAYVYLRANPRGRTREHWQHVGGCRRFLVVERDTVTHAVHAVSDGAARSDGEPA